MNMFYTRCTEESMNMYSTGCTDGSMNMYAITDPRKDGARSLLASLPSRTGVVEHVQVTVTVL